MGAATGAHISSATRRNVVGCSHGLSGVSASTRRSSRGLSSGFGRAFGVSGAGGASEASPLAVATEDESFCLSHDDKAEEGEAPPGALAASAGSAATSRAIRTTAQGKKRRIAFPWGAEGARSRVRTTLASGGRDTRAS